MTEDNFMFVPGEKQCYLQTLSKNVPYLLAMKLRVSWEIITSKQIPNENLLWDIPGQSLVKQGANF